MDDPCRVLLVLALTFSSPSARLLAPSVAMGLQGRHLYARNARKIDHSILNACTTGYRTQITIGCIYLQGQRPTIVGEAGKASSNIIFGQ